MPCILNSRVLLSLLTIWLFVGSASARAEQRQIVDMLETPVDVEQAALFAATTATFDALCDGHVENPGAVSIIRRLEYGALGAEGQQSYKDLMLEQHNSNLDIWNGLTNASDKRLFCQGLETSIISRAADFIRAHSSLFQIDSRVPTGTARNFTDVIEKGLEA